MMRAVRSGSGFTLIELLVTVLIIGILAAIGMASYKGQRNRAHHAEAASALRTAVAASLSYYNGRGGGDDGFTGLKPSTLKAEERTLYPGTVDNPSADLNPGPGAEPRQIAIWRYDQVEINETTSNVLYAGVYLCSISRGEEILCAQVERWSGTTSNYVRYATYKGSDISLNDLNGAAAGTPKPSASAGGWQDSRL